MPAMNNNNNRAANAMNSSSGKGLVPFEILYPIIEPQLDKDRVVQLQDLFARLRNGSLSKEEFVRGLKTLVGDHMLTMAFYKLQTTRADNTNGLSGFPTAKGPRIQTDSRGVSGSLQLSAGDTNASSPIQHLTSDPQSLLVRQQSRASVTNIAQGDAPSVLDDTDRTHHHHYHHHHYHHHHVMDTSENIDKQLSKAHIMKSNQQAPNAMTTPSGNQVPFAKLYAILEPLLDKDSATQLLVQYALCLINNISKDEFVEYMRTLVGDETLKKAAYKVATSLDLC